MVQVTLPKRQGMTGEHSKPSSSQQVCPK
jgi:hypothetical protein